MQKCDTAHRLYMSRDAAVCQRKLRGNNVLQHLTPMLIISESLPLSNIFQNQYERGLALEKGVLMPYKNYPLRPS